MEVFVKKKKKKKKARKTTQGSPISGIGKAEMKYHSTACHRKIGPERMMCPYKFCFEEGYIHLR